MLLLLLLFEVDFDNASSFMITGTDIRRGDVADCGEKKTFSNTACYANLYYVYNYARICIC